MTKVQKVFKGVQSYRNISRVVENINAQKALIVCNMDYDESPVKACLSELKIPVTRFNKFNNSLCYDDAMGGVELLKENKCDCIVSIGDDEAINTAKCINYYATIESKATGSSRTSLGAFYPHLAVPSAVGIGSEAMQFVLMEHLGTVKELSHPNLRPDYVILDPRMLGITTPYQKKCFVLDVLSQAIESLWSIKSTKRSRGFSKMSLGLALNNAKSYLSGKKQALLNMMLASHYAGKAVNLSKFTSTYTAGTTLSSILGIGRGHARALWTAYVWKFMIDNIDQCFACKVDGRLLSILNELTEQFHAANHEAAVSAFCGLLMRLDIFCEFADHDQPSAFDGTANLPVFKNDPFVLHDKTKANMLKSILGNELYLEKKRYIRLWDRSHSKIKRQAMLRELQDLELETLLEVDRICKKHNIRYYLGEGTLLGAVRHNGFIPWDDDVDILMPREDYDRFVKVAPDDLFPDYILQCPDYTPNYFVFFAKVRMVRKTRFSQKHMEHVIEHTGPYIDVFPLDYVPGKFSVGQWLQSRKTKFLRYMLFYRSKVLKKPSKNRKKLMAYYASQFVSTRMIQKWIDKAIRKYNCTSRKKYIVNYASYYNHIDQTMPSFVYGEPKYVYFEGNKLPVPQHYDYVLTSIYGEYYKLPPKNKRKNKHRFNMDAGEQ